MPLFHPAADGRTAKEAMRDHSHRSPFAADHTASLLRHADLLSSHPNTFMAVLKNPCFKLDNSARESDWKVPTQHHDRPRQISSLFSSRQGEALDRAVAKSAATEREQAAVEKMSQSEMQEFCASPNDDKTVLDKVDRALEVGDISEFYDLLNSNNSFNPVDVLRLICSKDNVKEETRCRFASMLLFKHDAHGNSEPFPVHKAAAKGLCRLLAVLVNHPEHPADATVLSRNGETAIHAAVRAASLRKREGDTSVSEEAVLRCIKILASKNCDIHARDNISDKFTAVHFAALHKLWILVDYFLSQNVNIDIEIGNTTARELIKSFDYRWVVYYDGCSETGEDSREKLVSTIEKSSLATKDKEEYFVNWLENNKYEDLKVNEPFKGRYTLLECAIKNRLPEMARALIKGGADPNPALFTSVAAGEQYFNLLKESETKLDLSKMVQGKCKQTVLHKAALSSSPSVNVVQHLLQEGELQVKNFREWVNARDFKGWTALHYAAKRHLNDVVTVLLRYKANIFVVDDFDQPAFYHMRPELIEEHLNDHIRLSESSLMDDDCGIVFDFNFLNIPRERADNRMTPHKNSRDSYLAVEKDDQKLVAGPVVTTNRSLRPEVEPLRMMANSRNHKKLLQHPIIRAFLRMKWHRLYWFYWLNCGFYLAFTAFFFLFVFSIDLKSINEEGVLTSAVNSSGNGTYLNLIQEHHDFLWAATMLLTLLLALRELSQLLFLTRKYIFKLENWLECLIIVLTFCLLMAPFSKAMAAVLSLLVSLEMVLLMSRHPQLATYIHMFLQVALNFIKFLLWYLFLIVAFGFSFYIIFPTCQKSEEEDCKNFFNTIPYSIFKTIVMISGEYESGDLEFDHVSVASHLIFIAFLFFISIVMVNLLNGLAVSDTQQIKNEAELIFCTAQAKFFADIESTLLVTCREDGCCPSAFRSLARWMSEKILLINNLLAEYDNKVTVLLNKNNEVVPDVRFCGENDCMLCCCAWNILPFSLRRICNSFNTIVSDALEVINRKEESDKMDQMLERLERLEKLFLAKQLADQ
ncbi:Hypothetical predicted protein [Cloeon dipterum]|uniref:Ion transport domain-containing protein n=1 Tax=Cloeon dipterum TaxID=197152 RepID=A0A8S1BV26_9INSE|nr:Hypothetical predicted protein [Cloeon dipterum]